MIFDFRKELPASTVKIGPNSHVRVYGFSDIEPRLVELVVEHWGNVETVRLHVEQAEAIATGLLAAARSARS